MEPSECIENSFQSMESKWLSFQLLREASVCVLRFESSSSIIIGINIVREENPNNVFNLSSDTYYTNVKVCMWYVYNLTKYIV